jgi:uncharacterized protein
MTYKPDICLYHAHCADGFGAAWAIWRKFGDDCQYIPASYGTPLNVDFTGKHMLMVDFSMKRDAILELAGVAASVVILDHHKSAEAELEEFVCGVGDYFLTPHGLAVALDEPDLFAKLTDTGRRPVAVFNMDKSGARMAWEFAHGMDCIPSLIGHIEDRDLWRFEIDGTREVCAALRSFEAKFELWDDLAVQVHDLHKQGAAILRADRQVLQNTLSSAYTMRICGHAVPTVNIIPHFASEAGHELLARNPDAPFAVCWWQGGEDNLRHYSLRSEDHRLDVSEIAWRFHGGGHRNAAGFEFWCDPTYLDDITAA